MDRIDQLARRVGLSRTTVSRDLKWLSGETADSSRKYFRVVPDFNEPALAMETVDVFFEASDLNSLELLEKLCDEHPYTKYRARCFGSHTGVFAQFRTPTGTSPMIKALCKKAKTKGFTPGFTILPTEDTHPIYSVSRLEHWNSGSFTWDFDWKTWASKKSLKSRESFKSKDAMIHLLDRRDISILTQLSYGARRKHKTIINALADRNIHITSQDFSRRLSLLNDKFVRDYMIFLDTDAFDLYSNIILTAKCEHDFAEQLADRMEKAPIPFRSTLKIKDDFLLWFLRLPPSHLSSVLSYLYREVSNLKVSLIDYLSSMVYGIYAEAFDDSRKAWNRDRKFLVTEPIDSL
jgi:DNA-binding Lrp family transcriptional regulator